MLLPMSFHSLNGGVIFHCIYVPHLLFYYIFFSWKIIVLQCCIGFCHTTVQISHNYIYIYINISSLIPLSSLPSRSAQRTRLGSLCYQAASYKLSILYLIVCIYIYIYIYVSVLLSQFVLPSHSLAVSTSLFSTSVSPFLPRKQVH